MEGHIVRGFDGDLLQLRMKVLEMGGLAIDQTRRAVESLVGRDAEDAREVIERGGRVVAYSAALEEDIVGVIARRQPVASDLRLVLTVGKVANDLERVGAAARKIARLGMNLHAKAPNAPLSHFYHDVRKMARLATSMLRDALDSLDRMDAASAAQVVLRDEDLDREFQAGMRDLVTYVMEDPRNLPIALDTVFVLKALERVGDHARSVASTVPRFVASAPAAPVPGTVDAASHG